VQLAAKLRSCRASSDACRLGIAPAPLLHPYPINRFHPAWTQTKNRQRSAPDSQSQTEQSKPRPTHPEKREREREREREHGKKWGEKKRGNAPIGGFLDLLGGEEEGVLLPAVERRRHEDLARLPDRNRKPREGGREGGREREIGFRICGWWRGG
jgi:hypothetical protein